MPIMEESLLNAFDYVWVDGPGAPYSDDPGRWIPIWEEPEYITEMMDVMADLDTMTE